MVNFNAKVWEQEIYGQDHHLNKYPFDNVVSFVFKNHPRDKKREDIRILELGCGAGNNLWFAAREGFHVTGIDGSKSAIRFAKKRFEADKLAADFLVGDFTSLPFENNIFDIVIDRASLVCCTLSAAKKAIQETFRVLQHGGKFLFNPYSQAHSSFASGKLIEDGFVSDIKEGTLTGVGNLCFYSHADLLKMFDDRWSIQSIVHKEYRESTNGQQTTHAEWELIAEKNNCQK